MTKPYAIALLGFSSFERSTFESFFRLAARRQPGYELVETLDESVLLVANADDAATMRELAAQRPRQHVLLIGASAGSTGWAIQARPIKLMSVLTAIDHMLLPAQAPRARQEFKEVKPSSPVPLAASEPAAAEPAAAEPAAAAPAAVSPTAFAPTEFPTAEAAAPAAPPDDGILVVDDSETALHFMQNRLRRFGFKAELVHSGEQALERLAVRSYNFVFLDVMMDGMDGYQTCRAIKQRKYPEGKPPVVVMLTSRAGTIDKMKGSLAGCDAYLVKPLNERDLVSVLAKYDTQGKPPR